MVLVFMLGYVKDFCKNAKSTIMSHIFSSPLHCGHIPNQPLNDIVISIKSFCSKNLTYRDPKNWESINTIVLQSKIIVSKLVVVSIRIAY